MANAYIEKATVKRIFGADDQGASVYETIEITSGKRKGETFDRYYTLWNKGRQPFDFDEGDVISGIEGVLSVNVDEYEDKKTGEVKHSANITLNDVTVGGGGFAADDEGEDEPPF